MDLGTAACQMRGRCYGFPSSVPIGLAAMWGYHNIDSLGAMDDPQARVLCPVVVHRRACKGGSIETRCRLLPMDGEPASVVVRSLGRCAVCLRGQRRTGPSVAREQVEKVGDARLGCLCAPSL